MLKLTNPNRCCGSTFAAAETRDVLELTAPVSAADALLSLQRLILPRVYLSMLDEEMVEISLKRDGFTESAGES